ncbi:MAG TPA: glycosyltransferase [Blastocatellia bacterium]
MVLTDRLISEFAFAITIFLIACSAAGILLSTFQTGLSINLLQRTAGYRRRRNRGPAHSGQDEREASPLVSILKPVSGLEDSLLDNLESFAQLRRLNYELIISIADPNDPAIPVVNRALQSFPPGGARLVIGRTKKTANPKIERLVAAAEVARGDIFFISDSNVRVSPDDITRTLREFDDPDVGCVSNPFVGEGARSLGALVESLYLLIFVMPSNVLASWAGVPCVVGKSMALTRKMYEILGGFEAFGQMLAEDQSIAVATKKAGYKVVLAPIVVRNIIERRSVRQVIQRQVRWGRMRFSFSKFLYSAELLVNPLPLMLLASLIGKWFFPSELPALLNCLIVMIIIRVCQSLLLMHASGARISKLAAILVPAQDFVQAAAQVASYRSKAVNWRGFQTRLGPNSLILASENHSSLNGEYAPGVLSST